MGTAIEISNMLTLGNSDASADGSAVSLTPLLEVRMPCDATDSPSLEAGETSALGATSEDAAAAEAASAGVVSRSAASKAETGGSVVLVISDVGVDIIAIGNILGDTRNVPDGWICVSASKAQAVMEVAVDGSGDGATIPTEASSQGLGDVPISDEIDPTDVWAENKLGDSMDSRDATALVSAVYIGVGVLVADKLIVIAALGLPEMNGELAVAEGAAEDKKLKDGLLLGVDVVVGNENEAPGIDSSGEATAMPSKIDFGEIIALGV